MCQDSPFLLASFALCNIAAATEFNRRTTPSKVWSPADTYLYKDGGAPDWPSDPEIPYDVDVVIVGGGYSGLMSAWELQKAGLTTVVLEAKEVIGGRSRSVRRASGDGVIELGATWINNKTQPVVFGLTEEFGLDVAVQYVDGDSIWETYDEGIVRMPPGSPVVVSAFYLN